MSRIETVSAWRVERRTEPGVSIISFSSRDHEEWFVTVVASGDGVIEAPLRQTVDYLRSVGARIVCQDVFGVRRDDAGKARLFDEAFGAIAWPVTWVENRDESARACGTQLWAVRGPEVTPIAFGGNIAGTLIETNGSRLCRLGGLTVPYSEETPERGAADVLGNMATLLDGTGMTFRDVERTWFYNGDILKWYDKFNAVRNDLFEKWGVFDGVLPASTGVGARLPSRATLMTGLLAADCGEDVRVEAIASPLQGPAKKYGSSFSRAVELSVFGLRRLLISGTASIDAEGRTAHAGDFAAQTVLTMEVLHAILASRGMGWDDVTRAVAYVKRPADIGELDRVLESCGVPKLAMVVVNEDICREELLFEMELDAVRPD